MKENKVYRVYENGLCSLNKELFEGWIVQTAIPVGNGAVDYILVRKTSDKKRG